METEMIEKCMLQPVNPLMVGQSQAIPKKTTSHGCLWSFETISFYSSKLSPSIHLQPWICSVPTQSWQERCRRLAGVLQSFGAIDADFKINRNMFTNDIWTMQDL